MVRPGRELLTQEVEVDETLVGGYEKGGGGRRQVKKTLVVIAAEVRGRGIGRIRLKRVPDGSSQSLLGFVRDTVNPGSIVITDGLGAYMGLMPRYEYRPRVARNGPAEGVTLLPRVHRVAALLKRWLMGTYQGKFTHRMLDRYLEEFTFRFNRRSSPNRGMLFYRLLQQAVVTAPLRKSI